MTGYISGKRNDLRGLLALCRQGHRGGIPGAKVEVDLAAGHIAVTGGEASLVAQAVDDAGFEFGGPA